MLACGRRLRVKFILPALTEATSPFWRPVKYSLFPPLGLATLAAYLNPEDRAVIEDEHVQPLTLEDAPDLVVIQVYITNAYRAYKLADLYRSRGCFVALGGLHVTSLPEEAAPHADAIFLGPGEQTFPTFLAEFRAGRAARRYESTSGRTLERVPPIRRDLIRRRNYLVPNSIVVTRGCPQHCDFCYKDAFFAGGRSFYTQRVDDALAEIERLPGRHLYFLDDHLLGNPRFATALFEGMKGMNRLFQGAATVDSILRGDAIERAAEAGLRSLFVGFETLTPGNLARSNKRQNLGRDYRAVTRRLNDLGVMINGSFVFGMDDDGEDVFRRTVDWAIESGMTTATFHIQTPYPGTRLYAQMEQQGRIATRNWDLYDTRHVVYRPARLTPAAIEAGYHWAYREFYRWSSIVRASRAHDSLKHQAKHFAYASGWKKFEAAWGVTLKPAYGKNITDMFHAMEEGELHGIYAIGENPAQAEADQHRAQRLLEGLDVLVVQDIFLTRTAQLAHVVLPASVSWCESEGTVTNSERRVQRMRKALDPPHDARDDMWIISEIARRLGTDWGQPTAEEVWNEIRALAPIFHGMTYARLEASGGLQWPCYDEQHPGELYLHSRLWQEPRGGPPAPFSVVEHEPPLERPDAEYPFQLTTGRRLDSYNTGVQTGGYTSPLRRPETLDMSPEDVERLGLADGDLVRITSRRGSVTAPVHVDTGLRAGLVFMTLHFQDDVRTNVLTVDYTDPKSGTAEFKACAVRVEPAPELSGARA